MSVYMNAMVLRSAWASLTIAVHGARRQGSALNLAYLAEVKEASSERALAANSLQVVSQSDTGLLAEHAHAAHSNVSAGEAFSPEPHMPSAWKNKLEWVSNLGSGGSAVVHKMKVLCDVKANEAREVGMKTFFEDEATMKNLVRELETIQAVSTAEVRSPFVTSMAGNTAIQEENGQVYILMEYLNSGDMFDMLRDDRRVKEIGGRGVFISFFIHVLLGLKHMHEIGYVHMDLKLQNCVVDCKMVDGRQKCWAQVIDLGAALPIGNPAKDGVLFTKEYLAPEMGAAFMAGVPFPVEPAYDLYGVGVMLYYTLFKRDPMCSNNDVRGMLRCLATYSPSTDPLLRKPCAGQGPVETVRIAKVICGLMEPNPKKRWAIDRAIREIKSMAMWLASRDFQSSYNEPCRAGKKVHNLVFDQRETKDIKASKCLIKGVDATRACPKEMTAYCYEANPAARCCCQNKGVTRLGQLLHFATWACEPAARRDIWNMDTDPSYAKARSPPPACLNLP